jgi:ATP-dependent Clp protease ATP-binding subunit ClpA
MEKIVDIQMVDIAERLKENKIIIELDRSAKELLVEQGFDPEFGARPIKRAIRRLLEDPLSEEILKNRFAPGAIIKIVRDVNRLAFNVEATPASIETEPK